MSRFDLRVKQLALMTFHTSIISLIFLQIVKTQ